jgi:hypothetical protein
MRRCSRRTHEKNTGRKNLYRGLGSIDIAAIARSVLMVTRDESDPQIRYLHPIKSSLAPEGRPSASHSTRNRLSMDRPCEVNVPGEEIDGQMDESKSETAMQMLLELLSEGDAPVPRYSIKRTRWAYPAERSRPSKRNWDKGVQKRKRMVLDVARGGQMSAMPNENGKVKVAGYVKLAKLWERSRDEAIAFHSSYYANKYSDSSQFQLVGTYIDITGKKEIRQRPEMLRLIRDCSLGKVECIDALTSGYLAANAKEFSYLIKMLFEMGNGIQILTDDKAYNINTIEDEDAQREALYKMASELVALAPDDYNQWSAKVITGMDHLAGE